MAHTQENSAELIARVRRIAGQVSAIERGLERGASCGEVLHLVAAVRGAVNGLLDEIIVDHLDQHVAKAGLDDAERLRASEDLKAIIRRYSK